MITTSYLSLCKLQLTPIITFKIEQVTQVILKLATIVKSLHFAQGKNFDDNKPTYKTKDIYNIKANLWQINHDILSLIQILIEKLD